MNASERVLVTGATGCLGRHLAAALSASGAPIRALVRESSDAAALEALGIEVQRGTLVREDDLERAVDGVGVVFHLGGVVVDDAADESERLRREIERVNVDGTERLARFAAAAGARRFVFASSLRLFGFGNQLLWSEEDARSPGDLYARGKDLAEQALLRVGRETGLGVVNVRPRFVYGEHDRYILPRLVRQVERGWAAVPGDGALCSVVYVRDCVQALLLAAERPVAGETYNITSGECLTVREILLEVARALGRRLRTITVPTGPALALADAVERAARTARRRPPLSRAQLLWYLNDHHFSDAKARRELGYRPRYRLADALAEIDLRPYLARGAAA